MRKGEARRSNLNNFQSDRSEGSPQGARPLCLLKTPRIDTRIAVRTRGRVSEVSFRSLQRIKRLELKRPQLKPQQQSEQFSIEVPQACNATMILHIANRAVGVLLERPLLAKLQRVTDGCTFFHCSLFLCALWKSWYDMRKPDDRPLESGSLYSHAAGLTWEQGFSFRKLFRKSCNERRRSKGAKHWVEHLGVANYYFYMQRVLDLFLKVLSACHRNFS